MATIELRSDDAAGVLPEVLDALTAANDGSALAYGGDDLTGRLEALVREVFVREVFVREVFVREVFEHPTASAAHANRRAAELANGLDELGIELVERPDANLLFVRVADPVADVEAALAVFGDAVAPRA